MRARRFTAHAGLNDGCDNGCDNGCDKMVAAIDLTTMIEVLIVPEPAAEQPSLVAEAMPAHRG